MNREGGRARLCTPQGREEDEMFSQTTHADIYKVRSGEISGGFSAESEQKMMKRKFMRITTVTAQCQCHVRLMEHVQSTELKFLIS